jgi:hypothetical protein
MPFSDRALERRLELAKAAIGWDDIQDRLIRSFGPSAYGSLMVELNPLADCAEVVQK